MLGIVTASTNLARAKVCISSWHRTTSLPMVIVQNGGDAGYLGTVRAFRYGVDQMLSEHPEVDLIACLHDDVEITQPGGWEVSVARTFQRHPEVGLAGFGGAIGLGSTDLYHRAYDPMQLARVGFRSNLTDAESHGTRGLAPEEVVCLDGFSQIGRRAFWAGLSPSGQTYMPPWHYLDVNGFVHHFYDGALGCLARRLGWRVYYIPVPCQHLGGQTAVGDAGYQEWAAKQIDGGDRGFWEQAHRLGYDLFRDVLPLRLQPRDHGGA